MVGGSPHGPISCANDLKVMTRRIRRRHNVRSALRCDMMMEKDPIDGQTAGFFY